MLIEFTCSAEKTALLSIDMQHYFTQPDYPFGRVADSLVEGGLKCYFKRVNDVMIPNIQVL